MGHVIVRSSEQRIRRAKVPTNFKGDNEVQSAYEQIGSSPNRITRSWYRDIYDFYQSNEC